MCPVLPRGETFLAEKKATHCDFVCKLCGTGIELPVCCEPGSIQIKDGGMMCDLCGSKNKVPVCCGQDVILVKGN